MFRLLLLLSLTWPAIASEERARQVIDEMEQLYRGDSSDATMTMQVQTPNYNRTLTMSSQSYGKDYAFFRIHAPKKDRGVATLKRAEETRVWSSYFVARSRTLPPRAVTTSLRGLRRRRPRPKARAYPAG